MMKLLLFTPSTPLHLGVRSGNVSVCARRRRVRVIATAQTNDDSKSVGMSKFQEGSVSNRYGC